jgi:hypothetical protein
VRKPAIFASGSLVIVESILWFSVLTIIGSLLGLGGSPLPWASLLFLFAVGMGSAWIFGGSKGDAITVAMYQGVVALFAVYFTVAAGTVSETFTFKIAWPIDMFGGTYGGEGAFDLIFGLIAAGALWYRSQNIVSGGDVSRLLSRAFKVGTATIAIALVVQMQVGIDTGISALLLPFFGASLIGMAVSRLPQTEDAGNASWPVVIAISVFAILGVGIVGGLLTGRYGNLGVRGLVNLWGAFVDALLWLLRYPIELAMTLLWRLILWLKSMFESEQIEEEAPVGEVGDSIVDEVNTRADEAADFAVDAIRWPLSILLLVVLFFVLVFAYRRYSARDNGEVDDERESIRGDADAKADMMRLLGGLVPNWMKRGKRRSLWKWPEGEKGVAEAFLLYFDTLSHAIKRGMIFDPNVTPNERVSALTVFLPGAPIETVTSRFNAACYGAQPADIDELDRLRIEIDAAAKMPKPEDLA